LARRLENRLALVTGASRGIGAAVAKRFAAEGAHVVLVARTQGGLEEVDDAIREAGGTATLVPLDLQDFDAIDRLAAALAERHGKLDILLGNAAILGAFSPMSGVVENIRAYWGPYAASKAGLENMVQSWAAELTKTNVRANLIDPGRVRTGMRRQAYPGEDASKNPYPDAITDLFVTLAEPACTKNGEKVSVAR